MTRKWKKILLSILVIGLLYSGCNTRGILKIEGYFREGHRDLIYTPKMCYLLANIARLTYRHELAIGIMDRNLRDFPYESGATNAEYNRALCYEKLGDCEKAIQLYEHFLIRHPKDKRYGSIQHRIVKLQTLPQHM